MLTLRTTGSALPPCRRRAHSVALATYGCAQDMVRVVCGSIPARAKLFRVVAHLEGLAIADESLSRQQLPQPVRQHPHSSDEPLARRTSSDIAGAERLGTVWNGGGQAKRGRQSREDQPDGVAQRWRQKQLDRFVMCMCLCDLGVVSLAIYWNPRACHVTRQSRAVEEWKPRDTASPDGVDVVAP